MSTCTCGRPIESTAPWDQLRNGTTITVYPSDPPRNLPAGTVIHHESGTKRWRGWYWEAGKIQLISWPNRYFRCQHQ